MANILMVVAPTNFRDEEYFEPRDVLKQAGHNITVASTNVGNLIGRFGGQATAIKALDNVSMNDYDAIVFVGGSGSAIFQSMPKAEQLINDTLAQNKLLAAICLAPIILAKAGVLKGKRATCTPGSSEDLKLYGAQLIDDGVVKDGLIITADGPSSATAFGQTIANNL
jgi:protease I